MASLVSIRRNRSRRAFTLVELLVVISVIGMLAALLLPALSAARESSRRSACINNQRQVGLAIFQYEAAKSAYPGYVLPQAVISDPADPTMMTSMRPISWVFAILPWLERSDIVENFGSAAAVPYVSGTMHFAGPNVRLNVLVCPSDVRADSTDPEGLSDAASLSYVVNCGLKDEPTDTARGDLKDKPSDPPTTRLVPTPFPRDWAANGIFHYQYTYTGPNEACVYELSDERVTRVSASAITDGMATTLLMTENVDSGNWTNVLEEHIGFYWQSTYILDPAKGFPPSPVFCLGCGCDTLGPTCIPCQQWEWLHVGLLRINENTGLIDTAAAETGSCDESLRYARPSSFHLGGVVATFADAHVQFIKDTIDYRVYCLLMSAQGKYTRAAGSKSIDTNGKPVMFAQATDGRFHYGRDTLNDGDY